MCFSRSIVFFMLSAVSFAATVTLSSPPTENGLKAAPKTPEGVMEPADVDGKPAWRCLPGTSAGKFCYVTVTDTAMKNGAAPSVKFSITYYDEGSGELAVEYDSLDAAKIPGAFKHIHLAALGDSKTWKTADVTIGDARFGGRCNGNDFRIYMPKDVNIAFSSISVTAITISPEEKLAAMKKLGEDKKEKQRQFIAQLPAGSTGLFDEPYVPNPKNSPVPGSQQNLDLFVPPGDGPHPLVIYIHGGGWHSGAKGIGMAPPYVAAGLAFATLNYRLTVDAPFPAQIEDCIAALGWLRANAGRLHLDRNRIGVSGHSAGAHLAALLAVTGGDSVFKTGAGNFPPVQAAALMSGPFDLGRERGNWPKTMFAWNPNDKFCKTFFTNGSYEEPFAQWASPSSYVRGGLPPMLIIHGGKDTTVPLEQARTFADALTQAGNQVTFRIAPEAGHSLPADANSESLQFFKEKLFTK
ncbi:MAG: alpha/beta hydrolase [Spirochaetes bacterium]|nr:alpha/beta hydrolase [Spirochaetota bacterium]